jgi:hypothetical protein
VSGEAAKTPSGEPTREGSMKAFRLLSMISAVLWLVAVAGAQDLADKDKPIAVSSHPLTGDWEAVSKVFDGQDQEIKGKGYYWHIKENWIEHSVGGVWQQKRDPWMFQTDDTKNPREIDIYHMRS